MFYQQKPIVSQPRSSLLKGRDMLCFSNDWEGDPLSKTHLMRLLAKENRILWVNSIGYRTPKASSGRDITRAFKKLRTATTRPMYEAEPNLFVMNPLALPIYGPKGQRINRMLLKMQVKRMMRKLGFERPINWIFNPTAGVIARQLGEEMLIYYCVDEFSAFAGVSSETIASMERELMQKSDAVVVSAEKLYHAKREVNPNTFLIRHGVDFDHFRKTLEPRIELPEDLAKLPGPVIGYFGLMSEDWFDLELMQKLAKHFSHCSIVLLGKVTMDLSPLTALPNVHWLGRKPYESLPAYSRGFDVAIVPFPINDVTLHANPLKAREYLAAGLPVVSTAIPEVEVLGLCRVARSHEAFIQQVEAALKDPGPRVERSDSIRHESWSSRIEQLGKHLAELE